MPAIARGSSARSRRRQVSEDNIEEGDATQRSRPEDVEDGDNEGGHDDEDEQPRRSSKKSANSAKAGKAKEKSGKARRRHEEEEQEQEQAKDADHMIDVDDFQDQPLSRTDAKKVSAIAADWEQVSRNIRTSAFQLAGQVAIAMAEAGESKDGEAASKELAMMEIAMRELLDTRAELKAHQDTLDGIANDLAQGKEVNDVLRRYESGVEDHKEEWQKKTSRQKYAKDVDYMEFKLGIFEVQRPDQGMPPMTELIEKEDGDESDDEDIVVGGVSQVYTCLLTLTILENPVTSQVCRHSFCKAAIEEYLNGNRSTKKKCPATGCNKMIGLTDFRPDKELERKVKAHVRRARQRQAEADSGDDGSEIID